MHVYARIIYYRPCYNVLAGYSRRVVNASVLRRLAQNATGAPGEVHHTMLPLGSNPHPTLLTLNPTNLNP